MLLLQETPLQPALPPKHEHQRDPNGEKRGEAKPSPDAARRHLTDRDRQRNNESDERNPYSAADQAGVSGGHAMKIYARPPVSGQTRVGRGAPAEARIER